MYIFYPSCNFKKFFPETATRIREYLATQKDVYYADCCHKTNDIPKSGDIIVTVCMSCLHGLAELRPDIEQISFSEFMLTRIDFTWPQMVLPAIIVCGCNSAAYMSEVIRSGIQAIDKGQMEAARSLGMSHGMAMRLVIIPQAIRIILPAFCNEFVTLIKETSVLGYVGVVEILRRGQLWNSSSFETFPAYIGVALAYMVLTIPLSKLINGYERRMARKEAAA